MADYKKLVEAKNYAKSALEHVFGLRGIGVSRLGNDDFGLRINIAPGAKDSVDSAVRKLNLDVPVEYKIIKNIRTHG